MTRLPSIRTLRSVFGDRAPEARRILEMTRSDLESHPVGAARVAECYHADLVWLEEDCDGPRFLRALSAAGIQYRLVSTHTPGEAWIRRLPSFAP
jgi:hypothetical protein